MLSIRSTVSTTRGLAMTAALALLSTSCWFSGGSRDEHALAVKAPGEHVSAQVERGSGQPEYFEGASAPAAPAALTEQRPSAPSSAHVWIAGQHTRKNGQWVWVGGHYALPPRADVVWVPGHWVAHLHGYVWIAGGWR